MASNETAVDRGALIAPPENTAHRDIAHVGDVSAVRFVQILLPQGVGQ